MTDSAKVILKKEEVKKNKEEGKRKTGLSACPSGLAPLSASPSGTSSPPLSLAAKAEESCGGLRKEILASRSLITESNLSYVRLSLLHPRADDYDGVDDYDRLAINMDVSFNNNTQFQKFKWRVTKKRSEFYSNLPQHWEQDLAYGSAWEFYNELSRNKWIGKACYRSERKSQSVRLKMVPLTAIVLWMEDTTMQYRFWMEDAEVTGRFDISNATKFYCASSNPINNFQPQGFRMLEI